MKKIIVYLAFVIIICFAMPVMFTNQYIEVGVNNILNITENQQQSNEKYDYGEYNMIQLLHTDNGEVEEVFFDEYLYNVVSAEMPANFGLEALKAQAVVARTYTLYKMTTSKKHENANICDDFACCQAWISKEDRFDKWDDDEEQANWEKIQEAVDSTKGLAITYNGEYINAFFHSNSGGTTEIPLNVWGGSGYPYLQTVETVGESEYSQYSSNVELGYDELIEKLEVKYKDININFDKVSEEVKALGYTDSGRVSSVKFGNEEIAGVEVRTLLGLRSTNFDIIIDEKNKKIRFEVIGYGHGVGMSQTGADAMAKTGSNFEQIIKHFYTDVEIEKI